MRDPLPKKLEEARILGTGLMGYFTIMGPSGNFLNIMSNGAHELSHGWEHVSVSTDRHVPNWREMCWVKNLFWPEDEWVVQFHPGSDAYVNNHSRCLHLWRYPPGFPTPPAHLVGYKELGTLT